MRFLLCVLCCTPLWVWGQPTNGTANFSIGAIPPWVKNIKPILTAASVGQTNEDSREMLFDRQVNIQAEEWYIHVARQVLNEAGVQNNSRLSFDFDPSYQRLTLHHIRIIRGANALNRLDLQKFNLIQQERDLDRHLYNGKLSGVLFLDDVRIGDVIEYAYTLNGFNPAMEGEYADSFSMQWSVPLDHFYLRILCPKNRQLAIRSHGKQLEPRIERSATQIEYTWGFANVPGVIGEDSSPIWFDSYPWLQISEYQTWSEVARWALKLYPQPESLNDELKEKLNRWKTDISQPEERLVAALDFMQGEVRYLGIELGGGSYQPSDPNTVFARRFGDCKDKAYLLSTLLNELGFKARPALVNTVSRHTIADWLPSPGVFNHVVVQVQIGEKTFWIDPTRSQQRGPLTARYFPDYGRALVIDPKTTDLVVIPFPTTGLPKTEMRETLFVKGRKAPVEFTVGTTTEGADADKLRDDISSSRREELEKNYLNFYARAYPTIQVVRPMEVKDQRGENIIKTSEYYRIKGFWVLSDDKKTFQCEFYPSAIGVLLDKPDTRLRSTPLGITHPVRHILRTEVYLPEEWPLKDNKEVIESKAFKLTATRTYKNKKLVMEYDYESLTNVVPVSDVAAYLKSVDQAKDALGYSLTWANEDVPAAVSSWSPNWILVIMAVLFLVPLLAGAVFIYRQKVPQAPPVIETGFSSEPRGIGGWLILVAFAVIATPIRLAFNFVENGSLYSAETWHTLTVPGNVSYHALWAPMIIFTLLAQLTWFVASILLMALFFQKRRMLPHFYIAFLLGSAALVTIDHYGTGMLPGGEIGKEEVRTLTRSYMVCVIWIPYMLRSRRVKATFVN